MRGVVRTIQLCITDRWPDRDRYAGYGSEDRSKPPPHATLCTDAGYGNAGGGTLLAPIDIEIDVDYNALILRPQFDSEFLGTEWFNQEPWFVNGGPGRVVIHTGGRGLIRVTVAGTEGVAPPITDSLLGEWEDIGEASFTTEDDEICFDGLTGSIIGPMDTAGPGSYRIRVLARGRTEYWDSYPPKSEQPWVHLQLQIWPQTPAPRRLIQYRDRFTGDVVRPAGGLV